MSATYFFASAVLGGFVLLGLVVYSYVRPQPEHRPSVTALLGLLGFALIASPNWTSISIKGEGLELSLLREMQARQLEALEELRSNGTPAEPPEPEATARPAARPGPRGGTADDGDGEDPAPDRRPTATGDAIPPERAERLLAAFDQGALELQRLSTRELLALNARLNERGNGKAEKSR